jgi:hypothetical protein
VRGDLPVDGRLEHGLAAEPALAGVLVREGDDERGVELERAGVEAAVDGGADEPAEDREGDLVALRMELGGPVGGVIQEVRVAARLVEGAPARADDGPHLVERAGAGLVEEGAGDAGADALGAGEAARALVGLVYPFDERGVRIGGERLRATAASSSARARAAAAASVTAALSARASVRRRTTRSPAAMPSSTAGE